MNKKVMVVDDEFEIADILKEFLSKNPLITVNTCSNPESAMEILRDNRYDLVLVDIMMPMLNGLDILKEIKQMQPSIKAVMMTAYSTQDKVKKSDEYGADAFLTKPFSSLHEVKNTVERLLGI